MIPRLAAEGASFHGAFLYYCHDKKSRTNARVAWTETANMMTDCCEKAAKVMAYTAKVATRLKRAAGKKRAGDKIAKPVISWSLSWHPEQKPDKDTMLNAARETINRLGLNEHEALIVAHHDEPQPHVHIIANRIHPLTGMAANLYRSRRKLQAWAREFQRKEGTMYCPKREENHRKRQRGKTTRYVDPHITEAWKNSDHAQEFADLLEAKGYQLARGRKRLVVVDPHGKTVNPVRHLENVRAKEFNERMASLDPQQLPTPEAIIEQRKSSEHRQEARMKDYKSRVAEALNAQKQEHLDEWVRVGRSHQRAINQERDKLTRLYKLPERREKIKRLQQKLDAPGWLQRVAMKIFHHGRKMTREIDNLQATQENARQRLNEAIGKLERTCDDALNTLEIRQKQEREGLINRLEKWRPIDRSQTDTRHAPDRQRSLSQDWQREGPSLGR